MKEAEQAGQRLPLVADQGGGHLAEPVGEVGLDAELRRGGVPLQIPDGEVPVHVDCPLRVPLRPELRHPERYSLGGGLKSWRLGQGDVYPLPLRQLPHQRYDCLLALGGQLVNRLHCWFKTVVGCMLSVHWSHLPPLLWRGVAGSYARAGGDGIG